MYWQHIFIPVLPPHLLDYCWYVWPPPTRRQTPGFPDECLHPLLFHPLPDSQTHLTHRDAHTHTHSSRAMCCCHAPSADAKAPVQTCRCTCSHLLSLFRWAAPTIASPVWPLAITNGLDHLAPYFIPERNAALSSFKPSPGFVSTHLMQIQQLWGYVSETGANLHPCRTTADLVPWKQN